MSNIPTIEEFTNPSALPPELQDPDYVNRKKVEYYEMLEREAEKENKRGPQKPWKSKYLLIEAVKEQINNPAYLFDTVEEAIYSMSLEFIKAAKRFEIFDNEDLQELVKHRLAMWTAQQRKVIGEKSVSGYEVVVKTTGEFKKAQRLAPGLKQDEAERTRQHVDIKIHEGMSRERIAQAVSNAEEEEEEE